MRLALIAAMVALAIPLFAAAAHAAECNWECSDEYSVDVDLCQTISSNNPGNYDSACLRNARDDYRACVNDCSDPLEISRR
jgi:hypothetical protein